MRRDWRAGGQLYLELRGRYKRRKRHYAWSDGAACQGKCMIDERHAEVETRQVVGHWDRGRAAQWFHAYGTDSRCSGFYGTAAC